MLRVAVITQDDPFYLPQFFRTFLDRHPRSVEIAWISVLDAFDESTVDLARRAYTLYGPVNFVRRGTEYVGRKAATAVGLRNDSVATVAAAHDVQVVREQSVNTDEFVDRVDAESIDIVLSVAAPEILDKAVLDAPSWGCLNVHTSELPKYRGMLPTFWALYHDESEVGVTVHTMTEEIDDGEIVRQTTFDVGPDDSLDEVITKGKQLGAREAAKALETIAEGSVSTRPMRGEGSYHSFPTAKERRELTESGRSML